jgi:hypothetical protein
VDFYGAKQLKSDMDEADNAVKRARRQLLEWEEEAARVEDGKLLVRASRKREIQRKLRHWRSELADRQKHLAGLRAKAVEPW